MVQGCTDDVRFRSSYRIHRPLKRSSPGSATASGSEDTYLPNHQKYFCYWLSYTGFIVLAFHNTTA